MCTGSFVDLLLICSRLLLMQTDMEEARSRVFADRQRALDGLNASKTEKQLLREKLRKLERQLKTSEDQISLLQSQRDELIKQLSQFDASKIHQTADNKHLSFSVSSSLSRN